MSTRSAQARILRRWRALIYSPDGPANPEARFVAITIAEYMDWTSLTTIVGVLTIAKATGYCEKTVRRRMQDLIRGGWLSARRIDHGRTWKLRELKLEWPGPDTGHETSRPVPRTGLGESWPVRQSSETGAPFLQDRYGVPPISSETNIKNSSEGAASPSPADACSAALSERFGGEARATEVQQAQDAQHAKQDIRPANVEAEAASQREAQKGANGPVRPSERRRLARQRQGAAWGTVEPDAHRAAILALVDQGYGPGDIARMLGQRGVTVEMVEGVRAGRTANGGELNTTAAPAAAADVAAVTG